MLTHNKVHLGLQKGEDVPMYTFKADVVVEV